MAGPRWIAIVACMAAAWAPVDALATVPQERSLNRSHAIPEIRLGPRRVRGVEDEPCTPKEQAIQRGLSWLVRHQSAGGAWEPIEFQKRCAGDPCPGPGKPGARVGLTGLAVLAFLGAGQTPRTGDYAREVQEALKFLERVQQDSGCIGNVVQGKNDSNGMYGHVLGTLALVEAQFMTGGPLLKRHARNAVQFLVQAQNNEGNGNSKLGWRYGVRPGDNDSSLTGWAVCTLALARSLGLDVPDEALEGGLTWLDRMTDRKTGRVGYIARGKPPARLPGLEKRFPPEKSESLTALGLLARFFAGRSPHEHAIMLDEARLIANRPPVWDPAGGALDMYFWQHATLALFQVGGSTWKTWEEKLTRALLDAQRKDGCATGSWDPIGPWGGDGGRVYATAMMTLCLEGDIRYERVFREAIEVPSHAPAAGKTGSILAVDFKETQQEIKRLRRSLKKVEIPPGKPLWEYCHDEARKTAELIRPSSPSVKIAAMAALFSESALLAAARGHTNQIAVVDHQLAELGMPAFERWSLLEPARKQAAKKWKAETSIDFGPREYDTSLRADAWAAFDLALQTAGQAVAAEKAQDAKDWLEKAWRGLARFSRAEKIVAAEALEVCTKQCMARFEERGEPLRLSFDRALERLRKDAKERPPGLLVSMANLEPDRWTKLWRGQCGRKAHHRLLKPDKPSELRLELAEKDKPDQGLAMAHAVMLVQGWYRPPRAGLYRFDLFQDDGGYLLVNHVPVSHGSLSDAWRHIHVYLEPRPYLVEFVTWDNSMPEGSWRCNATFWRQDGAEWKKEPLSLTLDADMQSRPGSRR